MVYHKLDNMQTPRAAADSFKELFAAICLGLLVGGLTTLFIKALNLIEVQQLALNSMPWPPHLFFLPVVLVFLFLLKKRTLYFPTKVSELKRWGSESCLHWNPLMSLFHFVGTLMSHMVGASVGREGVVILMSAGLVRLFQLSWNFWGPVAMGCGFSAILGNPWIGFVFMSEMFTTNLKQKIFLLIASLFAHLLMQSLQVQHVFNAIDVQDSIGFFKMLTFILILSATSGFGMRFYKFIFLRLSAFFHQKPLAVKFLFALILMGLLFIPQLRRYQSLGLLQIENLSALDLGFQIPALKLIFTLFSLTLGFWGGEFIPLIYTGLHFGATLASTLNFPVLVGTYMSCFLFFAGATRLKWTSFFLILSLMGISWALWLLLLVQLTVGFSGAQSLYRPHE